MASAMPEIIFVAGPQQGERAVIMANTAIIGRSPNADVRLVEEAASREHVRFQFTRDGWVMESLSANGTLINGKRYKRNKRMLLDTGDVMVVGLETKMLYVSPGDDPEEALQDWRQAHPAVALKQAELARSARPAKVPAEREETSGKPPVVPAAAPVGASPKAVAEKYSAKKTDELPVEGIEEERLGDSAEKGSKTLKVVLLVVVLLGMVGFGLAMIFGNRLNDESDGSRKDGIPRLTGKEITLALETPLERPPSPTQAVASLNTAIRSYTNKALWEKGDLYRCVKQFKLYRAYKKAPGYPRIQYERMADAAAKELDVLIREKYRAGWKFEKAENYRNAKQIFEEIERLLPVGDVERESQIYKVIITNVRKHRAYVKSQMGKKP